MIMIIEKAEALTVGSKLKHDDFVNFPDIHSLHTRCTNIIYNIKKMAEVLKDRYIYIS